MDFFGFYIIIYYEYFKLDIFFLLYVLRNNMHIEVPGRI